MKSRVYLVPAIILISAVSMLSQAPIGAPIQQDAFASIATDLNNISRSVQLLNERLKAVTEKLDKVGASPLTDKQQRQLLAMQILVQAEERVANLQKLQFDLTDKLNDARGKLAQTEVDLRPQRIDRSVAFEGTTETEELRDSRRQKLTGDRQNLIALCSQITLTLADTAENLRDASNTAYRLRRQIIPQIEHDLLADQ